MEGQLNKNPLTSEADRAALDDLANKTGLEAGDEFDWVEYRSASQAAEMTGRSPDPLVNPEGFNASERATYAKLPNATKRAAAEAFAGNRRYLWQQENLEMTGTDDVHYLGNLDDTTNYGEDVFYQKLDSQIYDYLCFLKGREVSKANLITSGFYYILCRKG